MVRGSIGHPDNGHRIMTYDKIPWEAVCNTGGVLPYLASSRNEYSRYIIFLACINHAPSVVLLVLNMMTRHLMETFSPLLAICAGNSTVTGEFPAQRPVTRSFDVFFDLRLNKRWSEQSWGWWLRRYRAHYDVIVMNLNDKFLFMDTIWANSQPHENEFRELANGGDQIGSLLNQAHSL